MAQFALSGVIIGVIGIDEFSLNNVKIFLSIVCQALLHQTYDIVPLNLVRK